MAPPRGTSSSLIDVDVARLPLHWCGSACLGHVAGTCPSIPAVPLRTLGEPQRALAAKFDFLLATLGAWHVGSSSPARPHAESHKVGNETMKL